MNKIEELLQAHQHAAFPKGIAGEEIEGEDLVSLDSFTAGCICTFCKSSGSLDSNQKESLFRCNEGLKKVLPRLKDEAKIYYTRLLCMTELALKSLES